MADDTPTTTAAGSRMARFPDQRSLTDQLRDLRHIADREGMYDAADFLAGIVAETDARVASR